MSCAPFRPLSAGALAALLFAACGTAPAPAPDQPDIGIQRQEPVKQTVCDDPAMQEISWSGTKAMFLFDTSKATLAPRDMGVGCNNDAANEWAPQAVAKVTIPGTGKKALTLNTRNSATSSKMPLFLQLREACARVPPNGFPSSCLGPGNTDTRPAGRITVDGGKTYFLFVSGYSEAPEGYHDRGPGKVELAVADAAVPSLGNVDAHVYGPDLFVTATAGDDSRNIAGLAIELLKADGKILDLDGNGVGNELDVIGASFDPTPGSVANYTGGIRVDGVGAYMKQNGATQARVRVFDTDLGTSEPKTVEIAWGALAKVGEACDATHPCSDGIDCTSGTCTAKEIFADQCATYPAVTIPTPTTETTRSAVQSGRLASGTGYFAGSCGPTSGLEAGFAVDVPEGTYDLFARTDLPQVDKKSYPIVYIRSTCADQNTELACAAGIESNDSRSVAVAYGVTQGRYYGFVEPNDQLSFATYPYAIQFALRPLLASGAACDTSEAKNRCLNGHCLFASSTCP